MRNINMFAHVHALDISKYDIMQSGMTMVTTLITVPNDSPLGIV